MLKILPKTSHQLSICESNFLRLKKVLQNFKKDKYEFEIDIREKRSKTFLFHRDGTSDFVLFIYPKENPTATLIGDQLSSNLNFLDVRKILPKIDQCDSIIIHNKTQKHAAPNISFKESNEEENMAFIRFSMTEKEK